MIYAGLIYCFITMVVILLGLLVNIISDNKPASERAIGLSFLPAVLYILVLLMRAWP